MRGKWVWDDNYPLYDSKDCRNLSDFGFRCAENGRPDQFYTKWRWQPNGCNLPSMTKAKIDSQQWGTAQDSLMSLGEQNVASVDSIVRTGMEANQLLRDKLSTASTALEDVNVASNGLLSYINKLRDQVEKLKAMYGSGIKALDSLSGDIDENSQSTFERLNTQVQKHSSALEDCFKSIALEADHLLNDLQRSLSDQGNKLTSFANQQREGHLRAVETSRTISKVTTNFFCTLDNHVSKLSNILKETQNVQDHQLYDLEKKFEECAANEERELLEKVAEMLASSSARKKKLVQTAVDGLRASAADRTDDLQKEMSTAHVFTSTVKEQWSHYMEDTEIRYNEDTASVERGRSGLEQGLQDCMTKAKIDSQQWRTAQDSLMSLGEQNVASVDSIVRTGMEANPLLRDKLSSAASISLEDVNVASNGLLFLHKHNDIEAQPEVPTMKSAN